MALETSKGLKAYSPEAQLLEQQGFDNQKAIHALTAAANLKEVQTVMSALQLVTAKTYAKVLHKETGKEIQGLQDDLGIASMLVMEGITHAELEEFSKQAQSTIFRHTAYSPLPSKAQALDLFRQVRAKLFTASSAALTLCYPPVLQEPKKEPQPMTARAARTVLELGFFKMMPAEHRIEVFNLVAWEELPKNAKHYFFMQLPNGKRKEIMKEQDKQKREKQTADEYRKIYSKKQKSGERDDGRASETAE